MTDFLCHYIFVFMCMLKSVIVCFAVTLRWAHGYTDQLFFSFASSKVIVCHTDSRESHESSESHESRE